MEKQRGTTTKILVSDTDMKFGSNRDINKDCKKLPVTSPDDTPKKIVIPAVQYDPLRNLRMLTKKHTDEKLAITLLIVGVGLIAYRFW